MLTQVNTHIERPIHIVKAVTQPERVADRDRVVRDTVLLRRESPYGAFCATQRADDLLFFFGLNLDTGKDQDYFLSSFLGSETSLTRNLFFEIIEGGWGHTPRHVNALNSLFAS